jgi:GNAT superfamily N-acetyltransferase
VSRATRKQPTCAACRIRRATSQDLPHLVSLLCALFAIETDFTICPKLHARGLRQLLRAAKRDTRAVLVAVLAGKVVGMASVQIVVSTAEGGPSAWIEDVVVSPGLRGQGIGARLMTAVAQWAGRHGALRLQLLVDQRNRPALGFYHRLGYRPTHMLALHKPMPSPQEARRVSDG